MTSELLTDRQGAALVLTLSDPGTRNSLSHQAIAAGIEALGMAESDPALRTVVLRGDGGHFSAGGNLQGLIERRREGPPAQVRMLEHLHQWVEAMQAFPKPLIAAVEGACAGAGFSLALGCDLIVAAEDARFVLSHGRIGLSPDAGATWQLARALPRALRHEVVWLGEPVSARRLEALGVVNRVCDAGQALGVALQIAEQLAAMAPNAVASAKQLLQSAEGATLHAQLAEERDHFVRNLFDDNAAEGLAAFTEKRAPRFR